MFIAVYLKPRRVLGDSKQKYRELELSVKRKIYERKIQRILHLNNTSSVGQERSLVKHK